VSSLPSDPAGRLQTVQEYAQAGYLSPRQARRLLDFPDLEQVESLANAQENAIVRDLDRIVEDGEMTPPDAFTDLAMARELALQYLAEGKCNGLEEERMELLRRYVADVDTLQNPPAPLMLPEAVPQAPPVPAAPSDLVPNVPALPPG